MRAIGFSTGSLALSDFSRALSMLRTIPSCTAVELSALRDYELIPLVNSLDKLDLSQFSFISFHAPSRYETLTEEEVIFYLEVVAKHGWPIVVHPDAVEDFDLWTRFGDLLCIENMDKRKPIGRTVSELKKIFHKLPGASLCFDFGHARQVDPTMCEAAIILKEYLHQLKYIHVSEVNSQSKHEPLSLEAIIAFSKVAFMIPFDIPVILETSVSGDSLKKEIFKAKRLFHPLESQLEKVLVLD